ncbi:MAG TPA: WecB/TagA/CpsF family glycosyltransferase [Bacteroidota bacterium]|nr:WecB/TagA/CpsF family glycosyltransferase [Bacteroidota bacterium]
MIQEARTTRIQQSTPAEYARGFAIDVPTVDVLGVRVANISWMEFLSGIRGVLNGKGRGWISYVNIHSINTAHELDWFKEYLNASMLSYCDGVGVRLGSWILGRPIQERITLADHIEELCGMLEAEGSSVYFLGSSKEVLERAVAHVKSRFPKLKIAGHHHGFFLRTNGIDIVRDINRKKPDILFVGMGTPWQEEWIQKNFASLNVKIAWAAGGFFEFLAGTRKRCPRWVGKWGLEWIYRLAYDPKRLWRRYLIGNPVFLSRVLRRRFSGDVRTRGTE